ncbi:MAG: TetR/AcrR family transcriptional regulator [Pseudomonadota bacterium]
MGDDAKTSSKTDQSSGTVGRKRHHHGDLRAALIAAAVAHVRAHGASTFSLRDATSGAGVTSGAAYRHFRSKDEVLDAVVVHGFRMLSQKMADGARGTSGPSKLAATGRSYVRFANEEPHLFALMFSPDGESGRAQALQTDFGIPNASDQLADALAAAGGSGESLFLEAWGLAHGLAALAAAGLGGTLSDQNAAIESFVRSISRSA